MNGAAICGRENCPLCGAHFHTSVGARLVEVSTYDAPELLKERRFVGERIALCVELS